MIKTANELAEAAKAAARNYKTVYIRGCFGWPMTEYGKGRAMESYAYNRSESRSAVIRAADSDTFGFDCVCFIKALLWDWRGDTGNMYGGAVYGSNGVPDINANQMIEVCLDVSEDFSSIQVGEAVWMSGHIGIYIGEGLAVECTPKWADGVQITAVHNIAKKEGYNGRSWVKHGKLPYVTYGEKKFDLTLIQLSQGAKGDHVKALQLLLIGSGCGCGCTGADGIFGAKTESAVKAYQDRMGLTVDGIAGRNTMSALLGVRL